MILTIDPGADAGWAHFDPTTKRLLACGLNEGAFSSTPPRRVIIERPHTGRSKASPKDIITLAIRAGEWGGKVQALFLVTPEYIEPARWKGSLEKKLCNRLVFERLSQEEKIILGPKKNHNVLDAVGIGLFSVGRFP